MSLLRMLGLSNSGKEAQGRFHDFTYDAGGKNVVSLVKHLHGDRVFLVGEDPPVNVGDCVLVKPPRGEKGPTRFRLTCVQKSGSGWRAYGTAWP